MKKSNQFSYLEIALYVLFFYGVSACVFLNGDDFMYGAFGKNGIVSNVASYYVTGNGRFWINVLDSFLLSFDRYLFLALNPLIIMAFLVLLAKNIQWITEKKADRQKEWKYFRYSMVLFACMSVMCLRETVFWITGMMNYLFPAMVFLLATWMFQMMRQKTEHSRISPVVYWAVCFFAGSSVEQYALMFVGVMTLMLACDLFQKRKIDHALLVGYVISLLGLALLILAPGNFVRVDAQNKILPPFIDNLWTAVYQNTMSPVAFPYLLMLSVCNGILIWKKSQEKWLRIGSAITPCADVDNPNHPVI